MKRPSRGQVTAPVDDLDLDRRLEEVSETHAEDHVSRPMIVRTLKSVETEMLGVRLPVKLKRDLAVWCAANGVSAQEVVRMQIEKFLRGKV